jgi:hypothetical protein
MDLNLHDVNNVSRVWAVVRSKDSGWVNLRVTRKLPYMTSLTQSELISDAEVTYFVDDVEQFLRDLIHSTEKALEDVQTEKEEK